MYKEIAFDPQCLDEYHYYGVLKGAFGEEKGRYVIAAFNEWLREAFTAVKNFNIQDIKKQSVKNYLNKLRRNKGANVMVLPFDRREVVDPKNVETWYEWLAFQKNYMDFDATVSERDIDGSIKYEDIIEECEGWSVAPSVRVNRNPKDIVEAILPLVRFGNQVTLEWSSTL
jgi:hypothetical protein